MSGKPIRLRGEKVREFILKLIETNDSDLLSKTMNQFGIQKQAVNKHLKELLRSGLITKSGSYKNPKYSLIKLVSFNQDFALTPEISEDEIWAETVKPLIAELPANVVKIWQHAFTEMFNNVIDHSGAKSVTVAITKNAQEVQIRIRDTGIGIFKKLKDAFNLHDETHAIFELSKGKLTTDAKNHSGEGIFFTSRMLDKFMILSGHLCYHHKFDHQKDFLIESKDSPIQGTSVVMYLRNNVARTTKQVFDEYSSTDGDYGFNKTVIPIALAEYGIDSLVSRSQAKRVLARVELFEHIVFDFNGVEEIGQAFADQIFRVFQIDHPNTKLTAVNLSPNVADMVSRAKTAYMNYMQSQS